MITLIPRFTITFNIAANTLTVTDNTPSRTANTKALIKATYTTDGTILYQHPDWNESPAEWAAPDIDGGTPTWSKTFNLGLVYNGAYKIEYRQYDSTGNYVPVSIPIVARSYTLAYLPPVVAIDLKVLCSSSKLISSDLTEYGIEIGGVEFLPTTLTRSHTITKPAGSGYTGTLGTTTDAIRTVGGGNTLATYLWTRVWQTNISTFLKYDLSDWTDAEPAVIVTDTVKGDDDIFAQCDVTICALAQCYRNLLNRWIASLTSNFAYRESTRDIIIQADSLWTLLQWNERCGIDTESTILALKELLAGENCNCTVNHDEVSEPIVPWGAVISGGSGSGSDFAFLVGTIDPTSGDGANGDLWLNSTSGDLFQKAGGAWALKDNIHGAKGDAGDATGQKVKVLVHDTSTIGTPSSTSITTVSFDFQINNSQFDFANDFMKFVYDVKLAHNQNGKLLTLQFAGDDIATYFTDDLVTEDNDRVTVSLKVTPINNVEQHLEAMIIRGGSPGEIVGPIIIRNNKKDLNTTRSVKLCGTNSEASVNDIICDCTLVEIYHRETVFISSGPPLSTGRGLVSQAFVATEGQTDFTVTMFEPNDYYIPLIDNVPQSQLVVTRVGYVFTYAPGLAAGQVLLIVD